jgi:hypothetical protein
MVCIGSSGGHPSRQVRELIGLLERPRRNYRIVSFSLMDVFMLTLDDVRERMRVLPDVVVVDVEVVSPSLLMVIVVWLPLSLVVVVEDPDCGTATGSPFTVTLVWPLLISVFTDTSGIESWSFVLLSALFGAVSELSPLLAGTEVVVLVLIDRFAEDVPSSLLAAALNALWINGAITSAIAPVIPAANFLRLPINLLNPPIH